MMDFSYVLTPAITWFITGVSKFGINSLKARRLAFDLIGYGGLPSNHSAVVSSMAAIIALKEGLGHPAFGVAFTLALIVVVDANSLRQQIGTHAEILNQVTAETHDPPSLRERIGHTRIEIAAGVIVGIAVATVLHMTQVAEAGFSQSNHLDSG